MAEKTGEDVIIQIKTQEEYDQIKNVSSLYTKIYIKIDQSHIVYFFAEWCPPCKKLAKYIDENIKQ